MVLTRRTHSQISSSSSPSPSISTGRSNIINRTIINQIKHSVLSNHNNNKTTNTELDTIIKNQSLSFDPTSPTYKLTSVTWNTSPISSVIEPDHQSPTQPPKKLRRISNLSPSKSKLHKSTSQPHRLSVQSNPTISPSKLKLKPNENLPTHHSSHNLPDLRLSNQSPFTSNSITPKPNHASKPIHHHHHTSFPNVFAHARHLLRLSTVSDLEKDSIVGRSQEVIKLTHFITHRYPHLFDQNTTLRKTSEVGKSLYISGPPGTGKTHLIHSVLLNPNHSIHQKLKAGGIKVHLINCIAIGGSVGVVNSTANSSGSLDDELWRQIGTCIGCSDLFKSHSKSSKKLSTKEIVEEFIHTDECRPSIIVLDEIDHLASSKNPLITSLLNLSHNSPSNNFTIIGIANTLDLTTRLISTNVTTPELIHFSAFNATELVEIVKQRLGHLLPSYTTSNQTKLDSPAQNLFGSSPATMNKDQTIPLFHPTALTLCAKKVSTITGDLRIFLSILRKLIDNLESNVLSSSSTLDSNEKVNSVLDTPTKMRKFGRIISSSQLLPDISKDNDDNEAKKMIDEGSFYTPINVPKITASEVLKHFKTIRGTLGTISKGSENECIDKLKDLNLQQSLTLVCLCVSWSRGINTKKMSYEIYKECNNKNLIGGKLSESEWSEVIESSLVSKGLIKIENNHNHHNSLCKSPSKSKLFNNSPIKSPTKINSIITTTPTKKNKNFSNQSYINSPNRTPNKNNNINDSMIDSIYDISILIQSFKSLNNHSNQDQEGKDTILLKKEMFKILNQVIIEEEKMIKRNLKRKLIDEQMNGHNNSNQLGDYSQNHYEVEEDEEEEVIKSRLVNVNDEGSTKD
ncbi:hypothetical protein CROQUDRAFT_666234 [Cronartium quercuum f. sp. fusiforme G11]|uniref:AAA+ ATPase domain-containing protein n=1 Tax=Cronartium quercuum f. sp. fusiforme G11 TaxID=708437 RepID=A0A9P6N959_9BASI|nr:hypothetical protein CROQUDRAFT_666234 [Cronartium quercuum f. sp. fusiforme G11]